MRKLHTLLALSLCFPCRASAQTRHPFDDMLDQEISILLRDNPITLFIDWLASPVMQNTLLFLTIMSGIYCLTLILLNVLMIREVLPPDISTFLKNWISIDEPVAVVQRKHPTPFELEHNRLQNVVALRNLNQPIFATINFKDETTEELKEIKEKLMGRKIEIVLSDEGNLLSIE